MKGFTKPAVVAMINTFRTRGDLHESLYGLASKHLDATVSQNREQQILGLDPERVGFNLTRNY